MRSFKAALFDLDGTLIDTESQYSVFWGQIGREYLPEMPDFSDRIKGTTLTQIYNRYLTNPEQQAAITDRLNAWEAQMHFPWIPGSLEFIRDIRKHGVKCAVVTSSNIPKMQSVARQIPNFHQLFDRVLTAEDFSASKPNPDCYLRAAHLFGLSMDECVVFEDAFNGLEAGMASGCFTIGLATGNPPSAIQNRCHHVELDFTHLSYEQIVKFLEKEKG